MNQDTRLSSEDREALLAELADEVRTYQNAQDEFDEEACARLGINRTDARCLDIVDRRGQVTAGELARESGLSTGAITVLLDRLERAGYVHRVRDTVDRRRVLVELSDEARRRAAEIWGPVAEAATTFWARYSDSELQLIRDYLRAGRELLADETARVRSLPRRD